MRRGDSCVNPKRGCFQPDAYLAAASSLLKKESVPPKLVLATDAPHSALQGFESAAKQAGFVSVAVQPQALGEDRQQTNFATGALFDKRSQFPEFNVGRFGHTPVSAFLDDVFALSECDAFVGTFTSAVAHLAVALAAARRGALPAIRSLQGCVLAECDAESFWALSRRPSSGFCPWQGSKPLSLLSSNFLTAGGSAEQREAALRSCLSEGAHRNASAFASYK